MAEDDDRDTDKVPKTLNIGYISEIHKSTKSNSYSDCILSQPRPKNSCVMNKNMLEK